LFDVFTARSRIDLIDYYFSQGVIYRSGVMTHYLSRTDSSNTPYFDVIQIDGSLKNPEFFSRRQPIFRKLGSSLGRMVGGYFVIHMRMAVIGAALIAILELVPTLFKIFGVSVKSLWYLAYNL
jgi:hypothetical protein